MATQTKARPGSGKSGRAGSTKTQRSNSGNPETAIDEMFRAFSDRTRLRILNLLLRGEMCVGDLVSILEMSQPRVSQHLSCLRNSGLVVGRREGQWNHYSLAKPNSPFHRQLLKCLKLAGAEMPESEQDVQRADALDHDGHCCS
ncbi:MAG: ArsR/SmtB family transcription factor [Rhodopirellula sp. JB053]